MQRHTDDITGAIVDCAIKIHTQLGPGLYETVYESVLASRLAQQGFRVERQRTVGFEFEGVRFEQGLCVDLLVDGLVIVELKSVEVLAPVHFKQTLTYLRLLGSPRWTPDQFRRISLEERHSPNCEQIRT